MPVLRVPVLLLGAVLVAGVALPAETIPVKYEEGTIHGFLSIRSEEGKTLAAGDLVQMIRGDRVISRLTFRFRDGSIDDETAVFSQRGCFKLISDHHIQKGPEFEHPIDASIDVLKEQVTVRSPENGREKVETTHVDLPPDLSNGMLLTVLKNISPKAANTEVSYLAATPKPRLIKFEISPQGEGKFWVAGSPHKALEYNVKVQLGGITGMIAPLIGKQPADSKVWVIEGEAPSFVRMEGPLYLGGPAWSVQAVSPVWQAPKSGR